jgi:hypothetical protein
VPPARRTQSFGLVPCSRRRPRGWFRAYSHGRTRIRPGGGHARSCRREAQQEGCATGPHSANLQPGGCI